MIYLASFVSIAKSLALLLCILLPLYVVVEIIQKIIKGENRDRKTFLLIGLYILVLVGMYYFFLTDRQRLFLFVYNGILILFLFIYFMVKYLFSKKS